MLSRRGGRGLLGWAGVLAVACAVWTVSGSAQAGPAEPSSVYARHGAEVYATQCAVCHGPTGAGGVGEGTRAGPAIRGLEVAYVDQQMRTGRMPIVDAQLGVGGPEPLAAADRAAVLAWMVAELDLEGDVPVVAAGDRARGHELYAIHCAACHGALGTGGVGAGGTVILGVRGHDRVAQVEAIRVGPYSMPAFDEAQLSDTDAADIAEFIVTDLDGAPRTPLGLSEMHRYTMWGMAAVLALALIGLVVLLGRGVRMPEGRTRPGGGGP